MNTHYWVFGVKYLRKGVEYTRVKSGDLIDYTLMFLLYFVLLGVTTVLIAANMIMYLRQPVFEPVDVTSYIQCVNAFEQYVVTLDAYLANCRNPLYHIVFVTETAYLTTSVLLTSVGIFLIYRFTTKIVSFYKSQIKLNWTMFILHASAMLLLIASSVVSGLFRKSWASYAAKQALTSLVSVLICYIIATMSRKNNDPLFIEFKADGNVFFRMSY
jgi:hypothetical protein